MSEGERTFWKGYADKTRELPPRSLLVRALPFVHARGQALDLGAGGFRDTRYLLDQGFAHVTALDKEPNAEEIAKSLPADRFTYAIASFEDFDFPTGAFDLVSAQDSLPYIQPEAFDATFAGIIKALKQGGIFTGNFFGVRDEWVGMEGMSFQTEAQARALLAPLMLHEFSEEEKDALTTLGNPKHWHRFNFIAEKV